MNRTFRYAVCAAFLAGLACFTALSQAQSPFDGTWHVDLGKAKLDQKPFTIYLSQGWYHCVSCTPPYDLAADGQFHPVAGQTFDEESITITDPHTLTLSDRKDGKKIADSTLTVSADGKILTGKVTSYPMNGAGPQNSSGSFKRVGVQPPDVHAVSGNWVALKFADTEADLAFTFKANGDEFTMTDPTGDSYTAKFDGVDYPSKSAYGANGMVSLKKIDAHTIEETDKRDGKVFNVQKMTVSPDGKSMTIVAHDPQRDTTSTFVATKK
jgi:hypothetical protein